MRHPGPLVIRNPYLIQEISQHVILVNTLSLVSTYVVCKRLSVMHEPAGVVEILVQILQNTPILKYSFRITPPPPINTDLGTLRLFSFRTMCGKLPHVETLSSPDNYSF